MARMSEDDRRKIEEGAKRLLAEIEFWDSLPEAERNKRLEAPKVSYNAETDVLWLKNGRPTPRSCEIVPGRVTAFFEAEIWYPSAVKMSGACELLAPFFAADADSRLESEVVRYGEYDSMERFLILDGLEIRHAIKSDYLWIGSGEPAFDGSEIAHELWVSFAEDDVTPVGISLNPAAELLSPILNAARSSKDPRLV